MRCRCGAKFLACNISGVQVAAEIGKTGARLDSLIGYINQRCWWSKAQIMDFCFYPLSVQSHCDSCWVECHESHFCGIGCEQCCVIRINLIGELPSTDVIAKCRTALRHYPIDRKSEKCGSEDTSLSNARWSVERVWHLPADAHPSSCKTVKVLNESEEESGSLLSCQCLSHVGEGIIVDRIITTSSGQCYRCV